jgi:processive 1,2-diacylglycerol beta-glucosyltransferase
VARVAPEIGARTLVTVTDHQMHKAWIVPGISAYCVADAQVARAVARRTGAEVAVTGIPIGSAAAAPIRAIAAHIAQPRVLALLGGVPEDDAIAAIDGLAGTRAHVRMLVGDEPEIAEYAAQRFPGADIAPRANGLLAAIDDADVVITKAGGLTVSECLARGRAMILPFSAPGQERGNLFYALDAGAAVRPGELADLGGLVAELAGEPGRLRRMSARARIASHPHAAADVVRCLLGRREARRAA